MEIKLRKLNELACEEHDKLNRKIAHVEKYYETLVEELKLKICRDVFMNQDEEYLEAKDMRK